MRHRGHREDHELLYPRNGRVHPFALHSWSHVGGAGDKGFEDINSFRCHWSVTRLSEDLPTRGLPMGVG